jgi:hypothetical protein
MRLYLLIIAAQLLLDGMLVSIQYPILLQLQVLSVTIIQQKPVLHAT